MNGHFLAAVRNGRKLTGAALESVADGRVWIAADAKTKGLIDSIGSFDQAMATLLAMVKKAAGGDRGEANSTALVTPQQRSASEFAIKENTALEREGMEWRDRHMEAQGSSLIEAKAAWIEELERRHTGLKVSDGFTGKVGSDSPAERWDDAVADVMKRGKSKTEAIRQVASAQPELHADYLSWYNAPENASQRN